MNNLLDYFTYRDRAGNRRLRRFTIASVLLALVVLAVVVAAWYNRAQVRAVAEATPKPVTMIPPTATATSEPEATAQPVANTAGCPTDPTKWAFVEYESGQHLRRIAPYRHGEPACVYDELARTVAWYEMIAHGHTGPEVAEALGLESFEGASWPYRYDEIDSIPLEVTTLSMRAIAVTNSYRAKRTARIENVFTPLLPEYRHWFVTSDGRPARRQHAVLGCFRAADIENTGSGIDVDYWWPKYPAMCWVRSVSGPGHVVHRLDDIESHFVVARNEGEVSATNTLYGATRDGRWLLLGEDQAFDHTVAAGEVGATLEVFATHHDLPIWDTAWAQEVTGLDPKALPEAWHEWQDRSQEIVAHGRSLVERRLTEAVSSE